MPEIANLKLVIGDKNLSSWSMRPWLALKTSTLDFTEILVPLDTPKTARLLSKHSPSGRVPVLIHEDLQIWDSLAICEYVHELAPERHLWPRSKAERARARAYCAEVHSSFHGLRTQLSMDIRLRTQIRHLSRESVCDIKRVLQLWGLALKKSGGPFLFGGFGIADAFFAPVVLRFISYGVKIESKVALAYMAAVQKNPHVREWVQAARKEKPFIPQFK